MYILLYLSIPLIIFSSYFRQIKTEDCKKEEVIIVSYNIENLFDTIDAPTHLDEDFTPMSYKNWNTEKYDKKISDIAKVLSSIDKNNLPDIVGLIEVENRDVLEDLIKDSLLKNADYQIVHYETTDPRGIDVALLYNPNIFEYISSKQLQVFDDEGKLYRSREILYVKGLLGQDTVHIFVNHWKSRSGGVENTEYKRIWAANILRSFIDKIFDYNSNANIICLGDFNDVPMNKSLNVSLNASVDSVFDNNKELFNLSAYQSKIGFGTYSFDYEWYMLDNIIVSQSLLSKKNEIYALEYSKVFKDDFVAKYNPKADDTIPNKTYGGNSYFGGVSDHFAVYCYLKVKK